MASAAEMEEKGSYSSVQELSIVDVPLPNLHILALSTDSSTLAATVDADIHFFSVESLLHKVLLLAFTSSPLCLLLLYFCGFSMLTWSLQFCCSCVY